MNKNCLQNKYLLSLLACAFCFLLITSCDNGNDGTPVSNAPPRIIGPAGGVVEVVDPASPVFGARANIPSGALTQDTLITIDAISLPAVLPAGYSAAGGSVTFGPDGTLFNAPIDITLPYKDLDNDGIIDGTDLPESSAGAIYFDDSKQFWEDVSIVSRDAQRNLVTGKTDHFSTYLVHVESNGDTSGNDNTTQPLQAGEYFVGEPKYQYYADGTKKLAPLGCLSQDQQACFKNNTCRQCATPYVLTLRAESSEKGFILGAVLDQFATAAGGYPVEVDSTGTSVIIDTSDNSDDFPFEKVHRSGDAGKWTWSCEYVVEWTVLDAYAACSDYSQSSICTSTGEKIRCTIEGSGRDIIIKFGVTLSDHTTLDGFPMPNATIGNFGRLCIAFEGWYNGP